MQPCCLEILSLIYQVYAVRCPLGLPIVCLCIWASRWTVNWIVFLFVESHEGATSDLGMAYNRARVLPYSDDQLGNSVANKVGISLPLVIVPLGPCLPPAYYGCGPYLTSPVSATGHGDAFTFFPHYISSDGFYLCSFQVEEKRDCYRDPICHLPLLRKFLEWD